MASLASTNVTENTSNTTGGTSGHLFLEKDVTLDCATVNSGGATNTIPASIFGMSMIYSAASFRIVSSGVKINAWPSADGSTLLLAAASTGTPADQTAVVRGTIKGKY